MLRIACLVMAWVCVAWAVCLAWDFASAATPQVELNELKATAVEATVVVLKAAAVVAAGWETEVVEARVRAVGRAMAPWVTGAAAARVQAKEAAATVETED